MRGLPVLSSWLPATVVILLTSACGDSLMSGDALDKPLFRISGRLSEDKSENVTLGILWIDPALEGRGNWVAPKNSVQSVVHGDGMYDITIWDMPPPDAIRWLSSNDATDAAVAFAWGEIIAYEDRNHDETFEVGAVAEGSPMRKPDRYRGMSPTRILLYVQDPLDDGEGFSGIGDTLMTKGFTAGVAGCSGWPYVAAAISSDVPITLTPPSSQFPDLRPCFRSHPE